MALQTFTRLRVMAPWETLSTEPAAYNTAMAMRQ